MHPVMALFGRQIPAYGVMAVIGFLAGLALTAMLSRRYGLRVEDGVYLFTMASLGAVIGAKLLYFLTVLPTLLADLPLLFTSPETFGAKYLAGGMVFYGGLFGFLLVALRTAKAYGDDRGEAALTILPGALLLAACGRIGCFLVGCCYGEPTGIPIGIVFSDSPFAPAGTPLFPTQLTEVGFDLLLGVIILLAGIWAEPSTRHQTGLRMLTGYLVAYAVFRFFLEFFRGDTERGILLGLSTSQWISLILITALVLRMRIKQNPWRRRGSDF